MKDLMKNFKLIKKCQFELETSKMLILYLLKKLFIEGFQCLALPEKKIHRTALTHQKIFKSEIKVSQFNLQDVPIACKLRISA